MSFDTGTRRTIALATLLLGLLGLLAGLQLHWVESWSTSEAARLEHFVTSGTNRVAVDLERELRALADACRAPNGRLADQRAPLARLKDDALVDRVLLLNLGDPEGGRELVREEPHVVALRWSPELRDWERAARELSAVEPKPVIHLPAAPPGMLVPLPPAENNELVFALLLLDPQHLAREVLGPLVEQHLGGALEGEVQVVVTHGGRLMYASHPGQGPRVSSEADATLVVGGGRLEVGVDPVTGQVVLTQGSLAETSGVVEVERSALHRASAPSISRPFVVELPAWEVRARHSAGSVTAAVAAIRRRNLALGLGVIGILACAALLLVFAERRARTLVRRQAEFVAGVTHELRTPLTVIRSAAENLRDRVVSEPEDATRYGVLIHDEAQRLTDFVERALALAGASSTAPVEPVELGPQIERAVARCRSGSESTPAVRIELPAGLPRVLADPNALGQALDNLLGNALKYGGEGAEVGVRVAADEDGVQVTVWDRGPGIPASERSRLFEPFYRGRAARRSQTPGSGLGLAVVRRTIEAQGGTVSVESAAGAGSAFTLRLRAVGA